MRERVTATAAKQERAGFLTPLGSQAREPGPRHGRSDSFSLSLLPPVRCLSVSLESHGDAPKAKDLGDLVSVPSQKLPSEGSPWPWHRNNGREGHPTLSGGVQS